jgi:hypothetical protein
MFVVVVAIVELLVCRLSVNLASLRFACLAFESAILSEQGAVQHTYFMIVVRRTGNGGKVCVCVCVCVLFVCCVCSQVCVCVSLVCVRCVSLCLCVVCAHSVW